MMKYLFGALIALAVPLFSSDSSTIHDASSVSTTDTDLDSHEDTTPSSREDESSLDEEIFDNLVKVHYPTQASTKEIQILQDIGTQALPSAIYDTFPAFNDALQWALGKDAYCKKMSAKLCQEAEIKAAWTTWNNAQRNPLQLRTAASTLKTRIAEALTREGYRGFDIQNVATQLMLFDAKINYSAFTTTLCTALAPKYAKILYTLGRPSLSTGGNRAVSVIYKNSKEKEVTVTAALSDQNCLFFITGLLFIAYRAAYEAAYVANLDTQITLYCRQTSTHGDLPEATVVARYKEALFFQNDPGTIGAENFEQINRHISDNTSKIAHQQAQEAVGSMIDHLYAALLDVRARIEPLLVADSLFNISSSTINSQTCMSAALKFSILVGITAQLAPLFFIGNAAQQKKKVISNAEVQKLICREFVYQKTQSEGANFVTQINKALLASPQKNPTWPVRTLICCGDISFIKSTTLAANDQTKTFLDMIGRDTIKNALKNYQAIAAAEEYLNALAWGIITQEKSTLEELVDNVQNVLLYAKTATGLPSDYTAPMVSDAFSAYTSQIISLKPTIGRDLSLTSPLQNYGPTDMKEGFYTLVNQVYWFFLALRARSLAIQLDKVHNGSAEPLSTEAMEAPLPRLETLMQYNLSETRRRQIDIKTPALRSALEGAAEQGAYIQNALQFERDASAALSYAATSVGALAGSVEQIKGDFQMIKEALQRVLARTGALVDAAITHAANIADLSKHSVENIQSTLTGIQHTVEKIANIPGVGPSLNKMAARILAGGGADPVGDELKKKALTSGEELRRQFAAINAD